MAKRECQLLASTCRGRVSLDKYGRTLCSWHRGMSTLGLARALERRKAAETGEESRR